MKKSLPEQFLAEALAAIVEDSLFALAAGCRQNHELLRALARRRGALYEKAARGASRVGIRDFAEWMKELCATIAPISPPGWMPMADLVSAGISLEGGARGMRSFFTNEPSEKEKERVKLLGGFAVRVLAAVSASDGSMTREEDLMREALVASLGLPDETKGLLLAEPPVPVEALEIPAEVENKLVRAIVRGAWLAAARDGLHPREEEAVMTLSHKLRALENDIEAMRAEALKSIESRHKSGDAAIDALRFMLADLPGEAALLVGGLIPLLLPPMHAKEPLAALEEGAPITLARRHELGRDGKAFVLALSWLAALHANPTLSRRTELVARHETIAEDLDAVDGGAKVREEIDAFIEGELLVAARGSSSE